MDGISGWISRLDQMFFSLSYLGFPSHMCVDTETFCYAISKSLYFVRINHVILYRRHYNSVFILRNCCKCPEVVAILSWCVQKGLAWTYSILVRSRQNSYGESYDPESEQSDMTDGGNYRLLATGMECVLSLMTWDILLRVFVRMLTVRISTGNFHEDADVRQFMRNPLSPVSGKYRQTDNYIGR